MTYIGEHVEDPIENSYLDLVDGLCCFHERYNIRFFIDKYLELLRDIKKSEQIEEQVEATDGGKWGLDPDILSQLVPRKELWDRFLARFHVHDE